MLYVILCRILVPPIAEKTFLPALLVLFCLPVAAGKILYARGGFLADPGLPQYICQPSSGVLGVDPLLIICVSTKLYPLHVYIHADEGKEATVASVLLSWSLIR